jgi:hypothetical protein
MGSHSSNINRDFIYGNKIIYRKYTLGAMHYRRALLKVTHPRHSELSNYVMKAQHNCCRRQYIWYFPNTHSITVSLLYLCLCVFYILNMQCNLLFFLQENERHALFLRLIHITYCNDHAPLNVFATSPGNRSWTVCRLCDYLSRGRCQTGLSTCHVIRFYQSLTSTCTSPREIRHVTKLTTFVY